MGALNDGVWSSIKAALTPAGDQGRNDLR